MVAIHKGRGTSIRKDGSSVATYFCIVLIVVFVLLFALAPTTFTTSSSALTLDSATIQEFLSLDVETRAMRLWRLRLQATCEQFLQSVGGNITQAHLKQKQQFESDALGQMYIPDPETLSAASKQQTGSSNYPFCEHIFVDLGTNRGDSISCAVDASLDVCSTLFVNKDPNLRPAYRVSLNFPRLHFDANDLRVHGSGSQGLSLLRLLQDYFSKPGLESVCVYGMEGNPYFTAKLQQMERVINGMKPRPLKHLHIHTETIITSRDGPASLYIDQYSEKNYFWGSSVLQSMPDIRKTNQQNNGTSVKADVLGITLSTLLRKTLAPFRLDVSPSSSKAGGSVLVKMDVEGAEFGVLKELAASNVLCQYVQMGNNATLVVEFHQQLIKDPDEKQAAMDGLRDAKEKLRGCGVKFRNLPDFWT